MPSLSVGSSPAGTAAPVSETGRECDFAAVVDKFAEAAEPTLFGALAPEVDAYFVQNASHQSKANITETSDG